MARPDYDIKWREDAAVYENADQLEAETIEWFKKMYSGDERLTQAYDKQKLSEYTSRCHINGISHERLLIISKAYLIFAIVDDFIDKNPSFRDRFTASIMYVTRNNKIVDIDCSDLEKSLQSGWSDVWQEIISLSPKHWQEHFALSLQYWFASLKIENAIRDSKRLLNYTEYHSLRLTSSFVDVIFDFMEFEQNEFLTIEDKANSTFNLLCIHAKTFAYLTNDLYSWPKEKRVGDNMNIMYLHLHIAKLSEVEAIATIAEKFNEMLDAMYSITDNYRALMSPGHDFFLKALSRFIRGNYDFHRNNRRYD